MSKQHAKNMSKTQKVGTIWDKPSQSCVLLELKEIIFLGHLLLGHLQLNQIRVAIGIEECNSCDKLTMHKLSYNYIYMAS